MTKIPPFRVFAQPSGLPTQMPMAFDPRGNESNLFVDIPTLTYWYWMMCSLDIDLRYTVNGGIEVPIQHHIHLDARKFLPCKRITGYWMLDMPILHDDDLDITTVCWLLLNEPRCDTIPQTLGVAHQKYLEEYLGQQLIWKHAEMPHDTRFGICFKFEEYADNRDFTICTLPSDIYDRTDSNPWETQDRTIIASYKTHLLGHEIPFYMSTPYPDDFVAHFDCIRITPEFFEIDPQAPPI